MLNNKQKKAEMSKKVASFTHLDMKGWGTEREISLSQKDAPWWAGRGRGSIVPFLK
jgi:hypothetical protein